MTWDKLTEPIIHWGKTWSKFFLYPAKKQTNKQTFLISLDSWKNGKLKKEHLFAHVHGRQLFCVFVRSQFHRPGDGSVISFNLRLADGCWWLLAVSKQNLFKKKGLQANQKGRMFTVALHFSQFNDCLESSLRVLHQSTSKSKNVFDLPPVLCPIFTWERGTSSNHLPTYWGIHVFT